MAREKNFENRIKKYLKDNKCWFIKYWAGAAFTKTGIPDLLICCNGYFVAVEVKAPNGTASELQQYNLRKINEACGIGIVLYPDQFDDFKYMMQCLIDGREMEAWKTTAKINRRE